MPQLLLILTAALFLAACTARVEYTPAAAVPADAIDVNTAAAADLERLPGIGPKTSAAIVSHREEYGPFRRREHIMLVPGISESRYLTIPAAADR